MVNEHKGIVHYPYYHVMPLHEKSFPRQRRVLLATSLSYIIVILDTSIVNVALSSISLSLHTTITGLQWTVNAYTLTFAALLLSGGRWATNSEPKIFILPVCSYLPSLLCCADCPQRCRCLYSPEYCRESVPHSLSPPRCR